MPSARALTLALLALLALAGRLAAHQMPTTQLLYASFSETGDPILSSSASPQDCARASYFPGVNETGWADLTVEALTGVCNSSEAAYAMGLLEGALSQPLIYDAFLNFEASNGYLDKGHLPSKLQAFVDAQLKYISDQWSRNPADPFWRQAGHLLAQARGVQDGYMLTAPQQQQLQPDQILILTLAGDLEDLASALVDYVAPLHNEFPDYEHMHCSGLVKLTISRDDLFTGHTTFNAYWCMLRIYKHYIVPGVPGNVVSFSSRPGDLHSKDDYFQTSANLTVIETSLTVFNKSLYNTLQPNSVPCWMRSQLSLTSSTFGGLPQIANRLATSSDTWMEFFARENSGTHNNQWIVSNYNLFTPGTDLPAHAVSMLEQMVAVIETSDLSAVINQEGYIASYNIPRSPVIFEISGYAAQGYSYENDTRARIFRRDQHTVTSLNSMSALLNANDYENDPLARGDPCNQISARCDLPKAGNASGNPYAFGGIDCKVTGRAQVLQQEARVAGAPSHAIQPVFAFTPEWSSVAHAGMPTQLNFTFRQVTPASWASESASTAPGHLVDRQPQASTDQE
ncbi:uncharacterized protein MONBRDRAFT_33589 [Monosiga brevicollis MX1]|uniref:Phospholipase B-like n=1 Tax=Monosiga brevicollis TaxID=81824 RepID=A9V691_MONBE|nr:uncharacterized protein MONBRDRAFT_33589 [Monosiga brevicollis MX1]EDQ87028.1 predicted protein [Monosiga brevicollis MX1]|eukprot:XP_001748267.1 hypothetical protein [Monosiga brevicollis MX1]